ncbi:MAG: topology modulation protein [candidate division Zixibacteria bacterium]
MFDITHAKRIIILGNGGSGKSTLAARLGDILQLPVFHLDKYFWHPGWLEPEPEQWRCKLNELIQLDQWIIDGNYTDTFKERIERADAVIYLDFSTINCLWNITGRIIRSYGRVRPDMADGCPEKFDWEFIKWIWEFKKVNHPRILETISKYNMIDRSIIFKYRKSVNQFIETLRQ